MEGPEKYISSDQIAQFKALCNWYAFNLGIPVQWLYNVMWTESRYNPASGNVQGFGGLIGFGKDAAAEQGVTVSFLKSLSAIAQLPYVYQYFKKTGNKWNSYADFYLQVLYPYAINKPRNYVFGSEKNMSWANKVAVQNPAFDLNKDGYISKGEFDDWVSKHFPDEQIQSKKKSLFLLCFSQAA